MKNKIIVNAAVIIALIGSFAFGVFKGCEWSKMRVSYVRLTKDIDFQNDRANGSMSRIQGVVKKGSVGIVMQYPYIAEAANKTIYFPIVIPYDKKDDYEPA